MHFYPQQPVRQPQLEYYLFGCLLLFGLFFAILGCVLMFPLVSYWDSVANSWILQLRSSSLDRIMLVLTSAADLLVVAVLVSGLVALLLSARRWWLATHLICVSLSSVLAVSIMKSLVARDRPELLGNALSSFSFPSGHACSAAAVATLAALFLSYRRSQFTTLCIYCLAALTALLIGFSRVYLQVHWPSDVLAGLILGTALALAFAWQLHSAPALQIRGMSTLVLLLCLISITAYSGSTFDEQAIRYSIDLRP